MPSDARFTFAHRIGPPERYASATSRAILASQHTDLELGKGFQFPPTFMDVERYNKEKEERMEEEARLGYDPGLTRWLPVLEQDREWGDGPACNVLDIFGTIPLTTLNPHRNRGARASHSCGNR